jgi:hypothetical protein
MIIGLDPVIAYLNSVYKPGGNGNSLTPAVKSARQDLIRKVEPVW